MQMGWMVPAPSWVAKCATLQSSSIADRGAPNDGWNSGYRLGQRRLSRLRSFGDWARSYRRSLSRIVGVEACGFALHRGRVVRKAGNDVGLILAAYVNPYGKRGKTDAADAEAICEAVQRPAMRFDRTAHNA